MIRRIKQCLNAQLISLCQQATQLDEVNRKLKDNLPSSLREHCQVASFNKGCLLISTTNAAWATELRYTLSDLRDKLRKKGLYQLTSIKLTIIEQQEPLITTTSQAKISLSPSAQDSILTASEICSYPPLKAALRHLARNNPGK